jgi:hypothetical protein
MCNLYSVTKSQTAIVELTRAMRDRTGNLPPMPDIFPDHMAPIVRNALDGLRELMTARWGTPGPPQFGGAPHPLPAERPASVPFATELCRLLRPLSAGGLVTPVSEARSRPSRKAQTRSQAAQSLCSSWKPLSPI